ncbi:hypothetical protein SUGI_0609790 [Cryptomeria japonica]|nr:hypothetical protein SUGI_0609790 [Cryptomeria japonica]
MPTSHFKCSRGRSWQGLNQGRTDLGSLNLDQRHLQGHFGTSAFKACIFTSIFCRPTQTASQLHAKGLKAGATLSGGARGNPKLSFSSSFLSFLCFAQTDKAQKTEMPYATSRRTWHGHHSIPQGSQLDLLRAMTGPVGIQVAWVSVSILETKRNSRLPEA